MKKLLLIILFIILWVTGLLLGIHTGRYLLSMPSDLAVMAGFTLWIVIILAAIYSAYLIIKYAFKF